MAYNSLEKLARRGEVLPVLGYFTTYMYSFGNVSKADAVLMSKT